MLKKYAFALAGFLLSAQAFAANPGVTLNAEDPVLAEPRDAPESFTSVMKRGDCEITVTETKGMRVFRDKAKRSVTVYVDGEERVLGVSVGGFYTGAQYGPDGVVGYVTPDGVSHAVEHKSGAREEGARAAKTIEQFAAKLCRGEKSAGGLEVVDDETYLTDPEYWAELFMADQEAYAAQQLTTTPDCLRRILECMQDCDDRSFWETGACTVTVLILAELPPIAAMTGVACWAGIGGANASCKRRCMNLC